MDTLGEIQTWIARQEIEEPLPSKAISRVTRDLAEGIKSTNPLPEGHCGFCSRHIPQLVPVVIKCCLRCSNRFVERGHGVRVVKVGPGDQRCESCLTRTFKTVTLNPLICQYCSVRIGRTHRFGLRDMNKELVREKQQKMERGLIA